MVPARYERQMEKNVCSGTLLPINAKSFYLIAQCGLKGTSKPVKYIVYLNENKQLVGGDPGLTMSNIHNITYQLTWKYPTAAKVQVSHYIQKERCNLMMYPLIS